MKVILYSTNCPKCKILKMKLDNAAIKYKICEDVKVMQEKGFSSVPKLEMNGKMMDFMESITWINELGE